MKVNHMVNPVKSVFSEKAVAGMAGAVGIGLAAPLLSKIPYTNTPVGRVGVGLVGAFLAVKFMDGYPEAVVLGISAGLVAQGLFTMFVPQLVKA